MKTRHSLFGPVDDGPTQAGTDTRPRVGFFTDTSVCIGCKACEVACKEWNGVPDTGSTCWACPYDNTGMLGADTWRHVAFIEQPRRLGRQDGGVEGLPVGPSSTRHTPQRDRRRPAAPGERGGAELGYLGLGAGASGDRSARPDAPGPGRIDFRWLMMSDVCKHCTHAGLPGRLPDRRAVPHRVRDGGGAAGHLQRLRLLRLRLPLRGDRPAEGRRPGPQVHAVLRPAAGRHEPACAKACPTESIQFGALDELRDRAQDRVEQLHDAGVPRPASTAMTRPTASAETARSSCSSTSPTVYGLPDDPVVPTPRSGPHVAGGRSGRRCAPHRGRECLRGGPARVNGDRKAPRPGALAPPSRQTPAVWSARDDGSGEASMVDRADSPAITGDQFSSRQCGRTTLPTTSSSGAGRGQQPSRRRRDRTGRTALRRGSRLGAAAAISAGSVYLIKTWPARALPPHAPRGQAHLAHERRDLDTHRLRPSGRSRRSGGGGPRSYAWALGGPVIDGCGRPAGLGAAVLAPAVASYTSVLIADTAVPAWHEAQDVMPFIFTASAAASAGGWA